MTARRGNLSRWSRVLIACGEYFVARSFTVKSKLKGDAMNQKNQSSQSESNPQKDQKRTEHQRRQEQQLHEQSKTSENETGSAQNSEPGSGSPS